MSMISEQINKLREAVKSYRPYVPYYVIGLLHNAADTIESLSAKLKEADCGGGWIIASERMPEEYRCIDPETGYYGMSADVLCSAYDEYEMRDEIWIDHTIDGEWQTHEWYEGEKLAWMPLPSPYRESNEP